jgi:hypothetical protein
VLADNLAEAIADFRTGTVSIAISISVVESSSLPLARDRFSWGVRPWEKRFRRQRHLLESVFPGHG